MRLQMLFNVRPATRIVTCNDNLNSCRNMPHVHCTFSGRRGQLDIAARVKTEKTKFPHATIVVILDYYWLQQGYYTRYGLHEWLQRGLACVLASGADSVLFPHDAGNLNSEDTHGARGRNMSTALAAGLFPDGVLWRYVPKQHNPLWVASDHKEIAAKLAKDHGGSNQHQTSSFLHPVHPFVEFTYGPPPLPV